MNSTQQSDSVIISALRRGGYKATPQRIEICRSVLGCREHPSAQKIYGKVKKAYPTVSLATIYKTLDILKELGMLQELSIPQGQARLDPNMNLHINLICLQCGKIIDSDSESLQEDLKRVAAEAKFSTALQRIDIYGKCEKCAVSRKPS